MELESEKISEAIRSQIKYYENTIIRNKTRAVLTAGDGTARISELYNCVSGELLGFQDGNFGMAQNLEENSAPAVLFGSDAGVQEGQAVKRTDRVVSAPIGEALPGHVVNAIGQPVDGASPIDSKEYRAVESPIPGIANRQSVKEPMQTGIKAIGSMIPAGRGQCELIIGDRQTGRTTIALDTILNQKGKDVICIYVAIGQRRSTVTALASTLKEVGVMDYTIVAAAMASESSPLQYTAPCVGCAMGEYFMNHSRHILIVHDDLSKYAVAYRAISLPIRRLPGRGVYLGDVFYLYSRLLERMAKLSADKGAGPMTALPIIETQAGDVPAYIPTDVIPITDGQIFLETELFHGGVMPAASPGILVSHAGGNAQVKAMKKVTGTLKLICSQFHELQSLAQFGPDLDANTKARLAQGERIVGVLKQGKPTSVPVKKQVVILYVVVNHILTPVPVEKIREFEVVLYRSLDRDLDGVAAIEEIRQNGVYSVEGEERLKQALQRCVEKLLQSEQMSKVQA